MSWIYFFDCIYVINLPKRSDRMHQIKMELYKFRIPFVRWEAVESANGQEGINLTFRALFAEALSKGFKNILVFEDDAIFLYRPHEIVKAAIFNLPEEYDILYLGANLTLSGNMFKISDNLIRIERALALHACAYSESGMKKIIESPEILPIDRDICDNIVSQGNCYAVYPMLCSQRPGYSDIEKRHTDYKDLLDNRFVERTKYLINKS